MKAYLKIGWVKVNKIFSVSQPIHKDHFPIKRMMEYQLEWSLFKYGHKTIFWSILMEIAQMNKQTNQLKKEEDKQKHE